MSKLWETTKNFFEADEWPLIARDETRVLQSSFRGKNGQWNCFIKVLEEQSFIVFYSMAAVTVPEGKRYAAAEFITRANYGMYIGNFEMDFSDGEVRYKTSVDVEGTEAVEALIKQLTYANVTTMDRYLPGLMAICYGNTSPEDAITMVERPPDA